MNSFFKNFGLFLTGLLASFMVISPSYRNHFMGLIDSESRHTLATLNLTAGSDLFKIVKIRKNKAIIVEIYKVNGESQSLVSSFELPDSRDVFYDFEASMSNLFSANIDSDDVEEVIVPVMDQNLVAHLSVIKFNPETHTFQHYAF